VFFFFFLHWRTPPIPPVSVFFPPSPQPPFSMIFPFSQLDKSTPIDSPLTSFFFAQAPPPPNHLFFWPPTLFLLGIPSPPPFYPAALPRSLFFSWSFPPLITRISPFRSFPFPPSYSSFGAVEESLRPPPLFTLCTAQKFSFVEAPSSLFPDLLSFSYCFSGHFRLRRAFRLTFFLGDFEGFEFIWTVPSFFFYFPSPLFFPPVLLTFHWSVCLTNPIFSLFTTPG